MKGVTTSGEYTGTRGIESLKRGPLSRDIKGEWPSTSKMRWVGGELSRKARHKNRAMGSKSVSCSAA